MVPVRLKMPDSEGADRLTGTQDELLPRWNLVDLFDSPDDPRIETTLTEVRQRGVLFAATYKGRIETDLTAEEFAVALNEFEAIYQKASTPVGYATLLSAADSDARNGAFLQRMRERTTEATLPLIFFTLSIQAVSEERFQTLTASKNVAPYRHFLKTLRAAAKHRLSEAEERILEEQANTGRHAFVRLYEDITAHLMFSIDEHLQSSDKTNLKSGEQLTLAEVLDLQHSSDRNVRKASAEAVTAGLIPHVSTIAFIYNTLVQEKATEDRLRSHAFPEAARHLENELDNETVEMVIETAISGFELCARYYRAKARTLNLPKLKYYDRYALLGTESPDISYSAAQELILSAFRSFHPEYFGAANLFFREGWIDAEPRPGKRNGAFCSYITPELHPYIFINYLKKPGDVKTLTHELGHGVHSYLSRGQRFLDYYGTLPIAEVASTFAELLVFNAQEKVTKGAERIPLFANQIEQSIATVFRQAAMYRFEQAVHRERREKSELSVERFGELWQSHISGMFLDSVEFDEGHSLWWTYIRHFVATPFYVYAYTFGEMLALSLYYRYKQEGKPFADRYVEFLSKGGAMSPHELVAPLGVDLKDRNFWRGALTVLEREIAEFEEMVGSST